jgi:hypothetical protein
MDTYTYIKLAFGALATIGLYSVLYRENKFYRFWEHVFLGLAVGYAVVALWTETLKEQWWDKMAGSFPDGGGAITPGYWAWILLLPIGLMGYFVYSRKHNWMSRIPIGILLGLWSGQQIQVWFTRYGPQINASLRPILPTSFSSFGKPSTLGLPPEQVAEINSRVYPTQAITNIIFLITLLTVLSYFLFSFELKSKFTRGITTTGRYLLMIGFGAIFGSTVMMRFTLLIDRMYFIWIEFVKQVVFQMK